MSNGRAARRRMASHDGTVIKVHACCNIELTVSPTVLKALHDDDCPSLRHTQEGLAARAAAKLAVQTALRAADTASPSC